MRITDGASEPTPQAQIFIGQPARRSNGGAAMAAQQARRSADGVEVNFDGAEVREVARVILGDILGLPYSVDPRVQGQVVLSSGGPLPERDLLPLLETVLRSFDAALLRSGGSYNIVPAAELHGPAEVTPLAGGDLRVSPGFGLSVVPLRYISAQTAAQLVQPLVSRADDIRVDASRNLLLFSGTGAERQNVVETLSDLDVDWLAGKSIGIFPLAYSTPEAVVPELEALFTPPVDQTVGPAPPLVRFMPIARLNAVLAISSSGEQMREIQAWIGRLDRGRTVTVQYYVYPLKHAVAEDMARVLNETFGTGDSGSGSSSSSSPFASALAARPASDASVAEQGSSPAVESPVPFGSESGIGTPSDLSGGSSGGGSGGTGVKIVANRSNNSLLIRATPKVYESIEATLRRLDTPPLQVIIEATIAEVTLTDALRYGVQYFLQFGSVRMGFNSGDSGSTIGSMIPTPSVPGFNFFATPGNSAIAIDALSRVTAVKVLSSPSVVVQDNSAAVLTVGDEVPVITRTAVSVETSVDAPVVNNIEYRDTGVILEVKPRINTDQTVSLDVAQEVSRVAPTSSGTDVDPLTPTFTQRKITSRVNVTSGQTVVLGGLIQESEDRGRSKVPVLGDIPVVGELFGSTSVSTGRTELIVFITPRVIRNAEDARDVSEELRSRLRSLRPTASPLSSPARPVLPPNQASQPGPLPVEPTPLAPTGAAEPDTSRVRFDLARAPTPVARPAPAVPPPMPAERPL
ncbi:MAG TPA: type II secretion system secretin GspD [Geminicoccaceae bacterium]|nr:type II secretion system secretin GspD [Geminicoccus sp.]HMU50711.1 type II secretion system secretin GspD [Geminicoccaceae bacterium]